MGFRTRGWLGGGCARRGRRACLAARAAFCRHPDSWAGELFFHWAVGAVAAWILAAAWLTSAATAAASGWTIEPLSVLEHHGSLGAVSCPAKRVCVAVGSFTDSAAAFERWDGSRWWVQRAPTPAGAASVHLSAISCSSTRACTAVGSFSVQGSTTVAFAERWNGSRWTLQRPPSPSFGYTTGGSPLTGVSCVSARMCVAVGETVWGDSGGGGSSPLVERWNGRRWSIELRPTPPPIADASVELLSVSCSSADACTAVGDSNGRPLVERLTNSGWWVQKSPGVGLLGSVSCASISRCVAVGRLGADVWDGTKWAFQRFVRPLLQSSVSCPSVTSCTAVGGTLAERWNGSRWSGRRLANPDGGGPWGLDGVSCASPLACTAVGGGASNAGGAEPLAERWNGRRWLSQHPRDVILPARVAFQSVSCAPPMACLAVGSFADSGQSVTARWSGNSWSIQGNSPRSVGLAPIMLQSVSCSSYSACMAVGTSSPGVAVGERWDGTKWSSQNLPMPGKNGFPTAVSCPSALACIAVGEVPQGTKSLAFAAVWNDGAWSLRDVAQPPGGAFAELTSVSCSSATACTAVGTVNTSGGPSVPLVERWDGNSWSIQSMPSPIGAGSAELRSVSCSSDVSCTAVGDRGTGQPLIATWNGGGWTVENASGAGILNAVSCTSAVACTAVGFSDSAPIIESWDGTEWVTQTLPSLAGAPRVTLSSVSCLPSSGCTAVGTSLDASGNYGIAAQTM